MINIISAFKISLRAIRVNKMRSGLTMLGIIIGVASVIAMLSIGTGASEKLKQQMSSIGSNLILVLPGATTSGGLRMGMGSQSTLTTGDAEAIFHEISRVKNVAPILNGTAQIVYGNQNWSTSVSGTTSSFMDVRNWPIVSGRNMTETDIRSAAKVAILGQTVVNNLFGSMDPVGKMIRIKKVPFLVIGVLEERGQSIQGSDQDDAIYIPISTAQKRIFGTTIPGMVRSITVQAETANDLAFLEREITSLLRQRHRLGPRAENDFSVMNLTQIMEMAEQSSKIMTLLLGSIASVSLLVGGIGIMNIMLVSVTERTREIGIRMAIGAKPRDIRLQFIIESLTLSLMGGAVGIALGIGGSKLLSNLADWPTMVSVFSVFLAFGFSAFVGLFFGFYPAYKASLLNPIDALRYE